MRALPPYSSHNTPPGFDFRCELSRPGNKLLKKSKGLQANDGNCRPASSSCKTEISPSPVGNCRVCQNKADGTECCKSELAHHDKWVSKLASESTLDFEGFSCQQSYKMKWPHYNLRKVIFAQKQDAVSFLRVTHVRFQRGEET